MEPSTWCQGRNRHLQLLWCARWASREQASQVQSLRPHAPRRVLNRGGGCRTTWAFPVEDPRPTATHGRFRRDRQRSLGLRALKDSTYQLVRSLSHHRTAARLILFRGPCSNSCTLMPSNPSYVAPVPAVNLATLPLFQLHGLTMLAAVMGSATSSVSLGAGRPTPDEVHRITRDRAGIRQRSFAEAVTTPSERLAHHGTAHVSLERTVHPGSPHSPRGRHSRWLAETLLDLSSSGVSKHSGLVQIMALCLCCYQLEGAEPACMNCLRHEPR